jgi:hypothetical protein
MIGEQIASRSRRDSRAGTGDTGLIPRPREGDTTEAEAVFSGPSATADAVRAAAQSGGDVSLAIAKTVPLGRLGEPSEVRPRSGLGGKLTLGTGRQRRRHVRQDGLPDWPSPFSSL